MAHFKLKKYRKKAPMVIPYLKFYGFAYSDLWTLGIKGYNIILWILWCWKRKMTHRITKTNWEQKVHDYLRNHYYTTYNECRRVCWKKECRKQAPMVIPYYLKF